MRFYDRQFITRENVNRDVLTEFERLLDSYFEGDKPQEWGLPYVQYFADELHLSANYFGDLVKKETGKTPQEHIHIKLVDKAKELLCATNKSVSEIAYELGFKYPHHLEPHGSRRIRVFPERVQVVGVTPLPVAGRPAAFCLERNGSFRIDSRAGNTENNLLFRTAINRNASFFSCSVVRGLHIGTCRQFPVPRECIAGGTIMASACRIHITVLCRGEEITSSWKGNLL